MLATVTATGSVGDGTSCFDQLVWVNRMFNMLWPKLMDLLCTHVKYPDIRVDRKMRAKTPSLLKKMHFSRFMLGPQSPASR